MCSTFSVLYKTVFPKPVFAEVSFTYNHYTAPVLPISVACVRDRICFYNISLKAQKYASPHGRSDLVCITQNHGIFLFLHIVYVEEKN